ncbi:MAG: hypothetical protein H5T86_01775 [Armatimonadetes bacterium]|nr:hypothetical protein [Armatimonadota bacterium]
MADDRDVSEEQSLPGDEDRTASEDVWLEGDERPVQQPATGAPLPPWPPGELPQASVPAARPARPASTTALVGLLLVLVLALAGACWMLWSTLARADQALAAVANAAAAVSGAASNPARTSQITAQLRMHQYDSIVKDVQQMLAAISRTGPTRPQPSLGSSVVPPEVRAEISPAAAKFFEAHPDLMERALELAAAARQLRDQGADVNPLRKLRDRMLRAAEQGDEAAVARIQDEFARRLQALGAPPAERRRGPRGAGGKELPQQIRHKLSELRAALERGAREGRDIRKAVRLAQRSQEAARVGNIRLAEQLLDRAIEAARNAPKTAAGSRLARRGPGGPPPIGHRPNPLRILDTLIDMIRAEEVDLSQTYDAVENAMVALREKNQSQMREILQRGLAALDRLASRRRRVSLAIEGQEMPERGRAARRPGASGKPPQEQAAQPPDGYSIADRLAHFLEQVRKMPEEEFQASKRRLAAIVFSLFLPPEPKPNQPISDEAAAERVKRKIRLAAGPYLQRKTAGEDVAEIEELFAKARRALYSGDVKLADQLADQALEKLGLLVPPQDGGEVRSSAAPEPGFAAASGQAASHAAPTPQPSNRPRSAPSGSTSPGPQTPAQP